MSGEKNASVRLQDEDARAKAASDIHNSYWVEAGAGTGKTTLLIQRLLNLLQQGAATLEQIVAITFTEKAAAELKVRLREELERLAFSAAPEALPRLRQALEEVEYAPITTIHAFAAGLLRERPVEAGVDPCFTVLDESREQDLLEAAWEKWFAGELAKGTPVLRKALYYGCTAKQLQRMLFTLYKQRDLVAEGRTSRPPGEGAEPPFFNALAAALPELQELLGCCRNTEDQGYRQILQLLSKARRLQALDDPLERYSFFLNHFPRVSAKGNQKNWREAGDCRRQKELCRELEGLREEAARLLTGRLTAELVQWGKGFLQAVEAEKEALGALDFQDLLLKARNLLRDSKEARRYFQERYRYLLVDEFQDTDPLQVEIVFFLCEDSPHAERWQEVAPVNGKIFLVGDPKQSIYRFRRADIEIYQEAHAIMQRHGGDLTIVQNFRTLPPVVDWVNAVFAELIKPQENFQPDYHPLYAYRAPQRRPGVVVLEPAGDLQEASADEVRAAEADALAGLLQSAVGSWPVSDPDGGSRPLEYGDCVLLFHSTTGIDLFEEALQERNIPYRLEGGKQFFRREEIAALRNLLAAVHNPYDRVALVGVLRYWAGISDEELFAHLAGGGKLSYLDADQPASPALQEAFTFLREAYRRQHGTSLASLVQELLDRAGYWQRLSLHRHGPQAVANVQKALALIRSRELEGPLTLKSLSRWMSRVEQQEREEAESLLFETGSDAVQLLTVHKAKGLEFPAVFLANLGSSRGGGENFLADRRAGTFEVKLKSGYTTAGFQEAEEREKQRREAEKLRLFYVAATRARDYLVLPRFYNKRQGGFWSSLQQVEQKLGPQVLWKDCLHLSASSFTTEDDTSLYDIPSGEVPFPGEGQVSIPGGEGQASIPSPWGEGKGGGDLPYSPPGEEPGSPSSPPPQEAQQLLQARQTWLAEQDKLLRRASRGAACHSVSSLAKETDRHEPAVSAPDSPLILPFTGQGTGAAFGSAFHQVMQAVDLRHSTPSDLDRQVEEAACYWGLTETAELRQLADKTLQHPLLERARRAKRAMREMPFVLNLEGELVEGIIDLLVEEEDGLLIVDYKTDDVSGSELERRWQAYLRQGQLYALAMSEAAGRQVKEVSFIFVRTGRVKTISRPDQATLREEALRILDALRREKQNIAGN